MTVSIVASSCSGMELLSPQAHTGCGFGGVDERGEPRAGTWLTLSPMELGSEPFAYPLNLVRVDSERFEELLMGIGFKAFKLAMPVVHVVVA